MWLISSEILVQKKNVDAGMESGKLVVQNVYFRNFRNIYNVILF